jgi:hypothetical protein
MEFTMSKPDWEKLLGPLLETIPSTWLEVLDEGNAARVYSSELQGELMLRYDGHNAVDVSFKVPNLEWLKTNPLTAKFQITTSDCEVTLHTLRGFVEALFAAPYRENSPIKVELPESVEVCYELYQVIGVLASELDIFETQEIENILDNASQARLVHRDQVLPFHIPTRPIKALRWFSVADGNKWHYVELADDAAYLAKAAELERMEIKHEFLR